MWEGGGGHGRRRATDPAPNVSALPAPSPQTCDSEILGRGPRRPIAVGGSWGGGAGGLNPPSLPKSPDPFLGTAHFCLGKLQQPVGGVGG